MKPVLVVKVGTSTLLSAQEAPSRTFDRVAASITALKAEYNIVLVTSGAIGFGVTQMQLNQRPQEVARLQALSMIGQVGLLRRWREAFEGMTIGQVLVTRQDLHHAVSKANLTQSLQCMWGYGAVPVVNENDAVSFDEITFGDNDQLAANVAVALGAEHLVLLTDQDGIQANFGTPHQKRVALVTLTEAQKHVMPVKSAAGKGGADSKVLAAGTALAAGVQVHIGHATVEGSIEAILAGQSGTKIVQ